MNKKYLGVDFGDVRTGLALSDIMGILASGAGTLKGGFEKTALAVAEVAKKNSVSKIILGHPINMNGTVAEVQIRESAEPPEKTEMRPANIIAARDGQIEYFEYNGKTLKMGELVTNVNSTINISDVENLRESINKFNEGVSNGEITILEGLGFSAAEMIGEPFESYKTPSSFVWNGETYTISNGSSNSVIRNEKKELVAELDCSVTPLRASFGYSDILQISPELQEINAILGEGSEDEIEAHFFTNGEDLFVGFVTEISMFGAECYLIYPVIFKTDLNFDSFEYIGCVSDSYLYNFYSTVQIDKIN